VEIIQTGNSSTNCCGVSYVEGQINVKFMSLVFHHH